MKVTITRSCMIKPSKPTFNGSMPLSESYQTGELTHIPVLYFYRHPSRPLHSLFSTLQSSLSIALFHFYPLAGRLRWLPGSRLELLCNGLGAQLVEADSDAALDDLGNFTPSPTFHLLIPQFDYSSPIEEIPLLAAQVTKFRCGGVAFGFSASHAVVDGMSAHHFLTEWARLARGEPLASPPVLDRRLLRAGDAWISAAPRYEHLQFGTPPLLLGRTSAKEEREKETSVVMLKLSKTQVEMLKKGANGVRVCDDAVTRVYTRYEAVAGHIWRCACLARGHAPEQASSVGICVDVRRRLRPPLPVEYFGNAIVDAIAKGRSGDVVVRPLGYAAGRIREAVERVTSEYVHSTIDFLKNLDDLSGFQDLCESGEEEEEEEKPFYGNPHVSVTSWIGLPLLGVDFGWGKEVFVAPATHGSDGESFVMPSCDGDGGLVVALYLQKECMDDFKKYFYQQIVY